MHTHILIRFVVCSHTHTTHPSMHAPIHTLIVYYLQRKTSTTTSKGKDPKKRGRDSASENTAAAAVSHPAPQVNPVLAGILQRQAVDSTKSSLSSSSSSKRGKPSASPLVVGPPLPAQNHSTNHLRLSPPTSSSSITTTTTPLYNNKPTNQSHLALAKSAVGKGVRHRFSVPSSTAVTTTRTVPKVATAPTTTTPATVNTVTSNFTFQDPHQLGMDIQSSLSELSNNYRNSLHHHDNTTSQQQQQLHNASVNTPHTDRSVGTTTDAAPTITVSAPVDRPEYFGMLSGDDSLVDLAMIPPVDHHSTTTTAAASPADFMNLHSTNPEGHPDSSALAFVDFPYHQDMFQTSPSSSQHKSAGSS